MIEHPHKSKSLFIRLVLARPRLLISFVIGLSCALGFSSDLTLHDTGITKVLIGWSVGDGLYLLLAFRMMFWSSHERMRSRALQQNEGQLVVTAALMSIGAIAVELGIVKELKGELRNVHIQQRKNYSHFYLTMFSGSP